MGFSRGFSGGGSSTFDGLADVAVGTPADNNLVAYDEATGKWTNQTPAQAGLGKTELRTATASTTLASADLGGAVLMDVAGANTATIPTNATDPIPVGGYLNIVQIGAGTTTVAAAAGVTLNGVAGGSASMANRWESFSIQKIGTDAWIMPNVTVA